MDTFILIFIFIILYFFITTLIRLILANLPRYPVSDQPDWGIIEDLKIPTVKGKHLNCWKIIPTNSDPLKLPVVLIHGWGSNRGKIVNKARLLGKYGYTTILISARDHGYSDKEPLGMNIIRFSHDIDSTLKWLGEPCVLLGHSIGAGASLLSASRNSLPKALICEAPPRSFPSDLIYIYKPVFGRFVYFFLPGLFLTHIFTLFRHNKKVYSPIVCAKDITIPVLLIHGKNDEIFPFENTQQLANSLFNSKLLVFENAGHSNLEKHKEYEKSVINFLKKIGN